MAEERVTRKLAAILAADMVGYSRLMEADETGTISRLKAHRKELIDPAIDRHGGRIFHVAGDGLLAEFSSVVEAVQCAVEVQQEVAQREVGVPEDQRIRYRAGINLGDVVIEGDEIFGDGVNIAARLETLAEPGGIAVSDTVHEQAAGKVEVPFTDLGPREVKNIQKKVRAWTWSPDEAQSQRRSAPELPYKPSIAVLPFVNLSADAEQEYFSDGITEDVITELSRFRSLFIIARNSSFAFKGQALGAKEISQKLGVQYVVEGSVRRAGKHVRITVQLIDAVSNAHLWAERYDRDFGDIFTVQDEVTRAIVTAIEPELLSTERQRARRKLPESLDAWDCYQRGLWHLYQYTAEDSIKARDLFQRAIKLDPNFAPPHAALGYALYYEVIEGLVSAPDNWLSRAIAAAKTAVALDERDSFGHMVLSRLLLVDGEYDASIAACNTAIELNPNDANAHYGQGLTFCFAGCPEAAIPKVEEALRLNPHDPGAWAFLWLKSHAFTLLHRYDEALIWAKKAVQQPNATLWAFAGEAVVLAHLGRIDEARAALNQAISHKPDLCSHFFRSVLPWKDPRHLEHYADGLRKAGLPEG